MKTAELRLTLYVLEFNPKSLTQAFDVGCKIGREIVFYIPQPELKGYSLIGSMCPFVLIIVAVGCK